MDFKNATDELLANPGHDELAAALVSVPTVRQARLDEAAKAHRNPPAGWAKVASWRSRGRRGFHGCRKAIRVTAWASLLALAGGLMTIWAVLMYAGLYHPLPSTRASDGDHPILSPPNGA